MISLVFSAWQLVLRRSLANWRLLSSVVAGVVVAVALLSSAPLYANVINNLGLRHTLRGKQIEMLDQHVYASSNLIIREDYDAAREVIDRLVFASIGTIVRQKERWIQSQTYYAVRPGERVTPESPKGHFHVFTNLEQHIKLVAGEYARSPGALPADGATPSSGTDAARYDIEGMIGSEAAKLFRVGVGDRLEFVTGYGQEERRVTIRLSAIIDPIDPEEEYWQLKTDVFAVPVDEGLVAPIFVTDEALFGVVSQILPTSVANYHWFYFVDTERINAENAVVLQRGIRQIEDQLVNVFQRAGLFTILDQVIAEYRLKLVFTQVPLFLLVFQIIAIILYYLVTVANMLVEQQSGEIALLRSRGASTWHIIGIYLMEGVLIGAVGTLVGPFLGAFAFSFLGRMTQFHALTGGGLLPIKFSGAVLPLALIAASLSVVALLVPAVQAASRGIVRHRQRAARPPKSPFWQRFYLDLVMLILGGVLYWELKERGSLLSMDVFGELGVDPLVLVTPMLFLLAIAIIFLRLFPVIIGLAARFGRYIRNVPIVLGLWYMARNPIHYGRLVLLLILTASVGMFSATFLGTLERSYDDRAAYASGGDVRVEGLYEDRFTGTIPHQKYSSVPGVRDASFIHRENGTVGIMFDETRFTLLAVDTESFGQVAWFREDFATQRLPELLSMVADIHPVKQGLKLPDDARAIGVWAYAAKGNPQVSVSARIKDGLGRYFDYSLGSARSEGWQFLEAKFTNLGENVPLPLRVTRISVRPERGTSSANPTGVYLDDLQVRGSSSAEPVVIEDFEDVSGWAVSVGEFPELSPLRTARRDSLAVTKEIVHNGGASGYFNWGRGSAIARGIYPSVDKRPIPVLASQSFLDGAKVSVGDIVEIRLPGQFMLVSVEAVVNYFPTVDPNETALLVADVNRLLEQRNLTTSVPVYADEAWLTLSGDRDEREAALSILKSPGYQGRKTYDRQAMMEESREDPLEAAGWSGMLFISFLGVVIIAGLGFVVYAYLSTRARQLEFAILRTLGFSLRQIIGLVLFEQAFLIIFGMGIGTFIGGRLSYLMMPFLRLTESGQTVLPPFVLTIDWLGIGITYIVLSIAFITTMSLVILYFSRVAISRALRIGDV